MTRMTDEMNFDWEQVLQSKASAQVAEELRRDHVRARSEEARLLKEAAKKDATIRVLADALLLMRNWRDDGTYSREDVKTRCDDALRLAGCLP
jgi:hypothetical protein